MIATYSMAAPLGMMRRVICCERGNVVTEFAFLAPVLILLTLAAVELGRLGNEWTRLKHAAYAATQYGIQDQANAANTAGMIAAARADADDTGNQLSVSARRFCLCPESSTEVACSAVCADGKFSPMYVEVTVSRELAAIVPYAGLPDSYPIAVQDTNRVR